LSANGCAASAPNAARTPRRRCIPASLERTHDSRAHLCRYLRLFHGDEEGRGELLQLGGIAERRFVVEHLQELRNDLAAQNLGLDFGDVSGDYRSVGAVSARTRACPTVISAMSGRGLEAEGRPPGSVSTAVSLSHLTAASLEACRDAWFGTISCVLVIRGGLDQGPVPTMLRLGFRPWLWG
jgi:hypothetical protein